MSAPATVTVEQVAPGRLRITISGREHESLVKDTPTPAAEYAANLAKDIDFRLGYPAVVVVA